MKTINEKILNHPYLTMGLILLITVFFFQQIKEKGRIETDLDKYMPQNHPEFVYSDQAEEMFDIKDGIIIAIEHPESIYNPETLQKVKDITKSLQKMDEIHKGDVTSLYTADNIVGTEEGMDVKAFYKRVPKAEKLDVMRQGVAGNDMVAGRLVSDDETVAVIIARIDDDVFTQDFYKAIIDLGESFEGPEKIYVAGSPIVEGTMALLGPADMKRMIPVVVLVILLVLFGVLRSVKSTLFTFLVVAISSIWTFGLMALVGIPTYAVSTMIPVMLIAIGVADGIHFYSHLGIFLRENPGADKTTAVKDMIQGMWKPVVMTSVTTAVGFISLLTSQVYPIKYFGLFTAFGVIVAMFLTLVLIPAGIMAFNLPKQRTKKEESNSENGDLAQKFSSVLLAQKKLTWAFTLGLVIISLWGINKVWINSSFLDKFESDSDIVQTDAFINAKFGGTSTINVILETDITGTFKQTNVLQLVDKMQMDVESYDMVGSSFALTDYLKRMNMVMNADDGDFNTIPNNEELNAQYLLLYEMSGDPENLWRVTDYDYRRLNVTFQVKSDNSKVINEVLGRIEDYRQPLSDMGVELNYAGSGYKALIFTDLILEGQIKSLVLSLVIIVALLGFMFKSVKAGLVGSFPIVITAIIGFGVLGIFNIPLSTTTALLSSIAIGIGIDFAVHYLDRYRLNRQSGLSVELAVSETMNHSGRAIVFNAIVVIAGFMVLLASVFPPNRALGALVSLNMFVSFVGTLTVMVLLIVKSGLFSPNDRGVK
ncbi:MAG: MMPL family transporter [Candidatus Marinimicrobia bacterium]|nr:MMPL family transporter [Candidatus Neomarinimicrobiota bacterium]